MIDIHNRYTEYLNGTSPGDFPMECSNRGVFVSGDDSRERSTMALFLVILDALGDLGERLDALEGSTYDS